MPRALAIVHQADAGPGVFGIETRERGWVLDEWEIPSGKEPPCDPLDYDAVFSFGGAMHPDQEGEHSWLRREKELIARLVDAGVPILGACLGSQLLADAAGASALRTTEPEIGWFDVEVTHEGESDPVIGALAPRFEAFQWHSYCSPLPDGAVSLAENGTGLQAYRIGDTAWGIQFHAEVSETDAVSWAVNYAIDDDAVRIGIDADTLSAEILERIGNWNLLGRALCGRFLEAADRLRPA
jgi:GMP synthase (glutamine-hydrolysing)